MFVSHDTIYVMKNTFDLVSGFSIKFSSGMLWGLLVLIFAIFCLASSVLVFHWQKYGMGNRRIVLAQIIYFIVSGVIMFFIFSSAIAIIYHVTP